MAYNIKECNRGQIFLMPPSLQEWLAVGPVIYHADDNDAMFGHNAGTEDTTKKLLENGKKIGVIVRKW